MRKESEREEKPRQCKAELSARIEDMTIYELMEMLSIARKM